MSDETVRTPEIALPYRPRCVMTDGALAGVLTARKRHRCQTHFSGIETHHIEPGDRYFASALPPGNPEICNTGWLHHRVCLDCCPAEYDPRTRDGGPSNG